MAGCESAVIQLSKIVSRTTDMSRLCA